MTAFIRTRIARTVCIGIIGQGLKLLIVMESRESANITTMLRSMPVLHGHVHVAILVVGQWRTFNTTLSKDNAQHEALWAVD